MMSRVPIFIIPRLLVRTRTPDEPRGKGHQVTEISVSFGAGALLSLREYES
jgi:hypothetical protein